MTRQRPTFRPVTDDEWQRMSWHARQRWLLAANALRQQLTAELEAVVQEHRSATCHALGLGVAFDLVVDDGRRHGAYRLNVAADEALPVKTAADHAATA